MRQHIDRPDVQELLNEKVHPSATLAVSTLRQVNSMAVDLDSPMGDALRKLEEMGLVVRDTSGEEFRTYNAPRFVFAADTEAVITGWIATIEL